VEAWDDINRISNFMKIRPVFLEFQHANMHTRITSLMCTSCTHCAKKNHDYGKDNHDNNVTDLINALPGNSSLNTVQLATIDEAVFSMSSALNSGGITGLCNPFLSNNWVNTLPCKRWYHEQYRLCFPWGLCRVPIREVNAVTEIV
jgi:hypothetical protein